jgi:AbrB family looped-hinge helix DNA binding protein
MHNQVTIWINNKGRVTLPKNIRTALGVGSGDIVFLRYEPKDNQVHIAPAVSTFDILAEHAINEYQKKHTRALEEFAVEHNVNLK